MLLLHNNLIENSLDFDNSNPEFKFSPFTIRVYFEWYKGEGDTPAPIVGGEGSLLTEKGIENYMERHK